MLLVFAAGMALPLLVLALAWGRLPFVQRLVRPREVRLGRWRNTLSGIIGGALTTALGILLLVTDGTTGLCGVLEASDQVRLEGRTREAMAIVPDWVVAVLVVVAAAGIWLTMRRRARRHTPVDPGR